MFKHLFFTTILTSFTLTSLISTSEGYMIATNANPATSKSHSGANPEANTEATQTDRSNLSPTTTNADSKINILNTKETLASEESLAPQKLIEHLNEARISLALKDTKAAVKHIQRAKQFTKAIINNAPKAALETAHIYSGRFTYTYDAKYKEHYFPIGDKLVEWKELREGPFWAKDKGIAVKDVELVYLAFEVNPEATMLTLNEAETLIAQGEDASAQAKLGQLVRDIVKVQKVEQLPLQKVRDNIALTRYFIKAKNYDAARYALNRARDGLKETEKDKRYKNNAPRFAKLREEINHFTKMLDKKDPTFLQKAEETLKEWWDELKNFTTDKLP